MPTCFLKRVLPFVLTLVVGLMLGSLFSKATQTATLVMPKDGGFVSASGSGWGCPTNKEFNDARLFSPREVDQKARVISRPEPRYTEEARENLIEGTVVLRAVFSEDGRVRNIRVVSGLPGGLTEKAVEAAQEIKFSPAWKDGHAVSQYIQIEYNFHLY